jgi:hypothetical protein
MEEFHDRYRRLQLNQRCIHMCVYFMIEFGLSFEKSLVHLSNRECIDTFVYEYRQRT